MNFVNSHLYEEENDAGNKHNFHEWISISSIWSVGVITVVHPHSQWVDVVIMLNVRSSVGITSKDN